ncbi:MAG: hypothetical protein ABIW85_09350, partial [Variovorax sp.]
MSLKAPRRLRRRLPRQWPPGLQPWPIEASESRWESQPKGPEKPEKPQRRCRWSHLALQSRPALWQDRRSTPRVSLASRLSLLSLV